MSAQHQDQQQQQHNHPFRSVRWSDNKLVIIDQRALPAELNVVTCSSVQEVASHIKDMTVRGAPAIGAAGAYGMAMAGFHSTASTPAALLNDLKAAKHLLDDARPTAVNLSWATSRLLLLAEALVNHGKASAAQIRQLLLQEANELADDDVRINRAIGEHGAAVVPQRANILHHCNTGRLATVDHGTALGVIYTCHEQKKNVHVWVDETRPRLQGAKLTAWELMSAGIDMHLIADSAAGPLMRQGKVDVVLYGADRVAANGDVCNKIGTYQVSVVAKENGVAVYAAVPTPTIDLNLASGDQIVIEERASTEITHIGSTQIAPHGVQTFNPAFDVTPHRYITGIITEEGICYPPFATTLRAAKEKAEKRVQEAWQARLKQYLQ